MVRGIELSLTRLGTVLAWLMIGLAVLATSVLVLRYGFGVGSIALQDAVIYLNALLVLLGISVTLTRMCESMFGHHVGKIKHVRLSI